MMSVVSIILILLFCFFILVLALFALSSCLGNDIRSQWAGRARDMLPTTFGLEYARMMNGGVGGGQEEIHLQNFPDSDEEE